MTQAQKFLLQGFNTSLMVRGVRLAGPRNFSCLALINWTSQSISFEASDEERQRAEVSVLNTVSGVFDLQAGEVLRSARGQLFTIGMRERYDIKVVFTCVVGDPVAIKDPPLGEGWNPSEESNSGELSPSEDIRGEAGELILDEAGNKIASE